MTLLSLILVLGFIAALYSVNAYGPTEERREHAINLTLVVVVFYLLGRLGKPDILTKPLL